MTVPSGVPEIIVSAAWRDQRFRKPLRTTDGESIEVVFRGTWSHGLGPDFRDALVLFAGRELRSGSVEVHRETSGWRQHGHHLDPRYDDVVLHVVLRHDGGETRRADGARVPIVELRAFAAELDPFAPSSTTDWSRFGGASCAPELSRSEPAAIREILWRLGDVRLGAKAARLEARLTGDPPGEVLYQELADGLGFSANREPMRALAGLLPLAALDGALSTVPKEQRGDLARGLLFGVAGFLPLNPADAALADVSPEQARAVERAWQGYGTAWFGSELSPMVWTRARVRPANHPAARLATAAATVAAAHERGGLVAALLEPVHGGSDVVTVLRELAGAGGGPVLGANRAGGLVANAVLPFALAFAEQTGDAALTDRAAAAWERLAAAEPNRLTRRAQRQVAGSARLGALGARGQQGLLHLDGTLCAPRRCFECPIAHGVVVAEHAAGHAHRQSPLLMDGTREAEADGE